MRTQAPNSYLNGNNSSCYRFSTSCGLFPYTDKNFLDYSEPIALIAWCSDWVYFGFYIDNFILDGVYEGFK